MCGDIEANPGPYNFFSAYHLNVRSIVNKIDDLIPETEGFDIIGFTETHLDSTIENDELAIPNYCEPIRRDRNRHGGGIAVYVRHGIAFKRRKDLESNEIESVCIEILKQPCPILCTLLYKPPNEPSESWITLKEYLEDLISDPVFKHIIMGDLNCNMLIDKPTPKLKTIIESLNLVQHITQPTRTTNTSNTLIDIIITNIEDNVKQAGTFPQKYSDHKGTFIKFNWQQKETP